MRDYFARRYSPANIVLAFAGKADWDQLVDLAASALRRLAGGPGGPAGRPGPRHRARSRRSSAPEDQQQTVVGVADGPPLESDDRYAAHLLATILGDHTGSRLYWALIDPGHADGAELSYQDYNQAGAFFTFLSCEPGRDPGQPRPDRRGLPRGDGQGRHRRRADPGQEQGARPLRPPERAARWAGSPRSGFHWTYRRAYLLGRGRARGLLPRHPRRPPPRPRPTGRSGR